MTTKLQDKVALVLGASSGIGEATALALAREGANVAVAARRRDRLDGLIDKLQASGGHAIALVGDVANEVIARSFADDAVARFGRLDILVNSAGFIDSGGVAKADIPRWRQLMDVNFFGALYTCHSAARHMIAQGHGDIINISSTSGRRVTAAFNSYCVSKHALNAMTEGMRQELGGQGIRVCVIEPGATTTDVAASISQPTIRDKMHQRLSKKGAMSPADVAAAVIFVLTLPLHVNVSEMLLRPTIDTEPM